MNLDRCFSKPIRAMGQLLWGRFEKACRRWMDAYIKGEDTAEARAAASTALNTWYSFAQKYNQLRTDKSYYWPKIEYPS